MKRIIPLRSIVVAAAFVLLACGLAAQAFAASTPAPFPTAALIKERVFNDCPSSTVTTVNQYPSLITIEDADNDCFGFANLHVWTLSADGTTEAVFDNPAAFRLALDFKIEGTGNGEGGLRVSPWWSHDTDGLFNVRSTDGEIACFGGRLPFYSFTASNGLHYVKGNVIHLEVIYEPHGLDALHPATIEYRVGYQGSKYSSGALPFDMGNPAEDPPHGLWGILNDARVGGHFKIFVGAGTAVSAKATFANIAFTTTPVPTAAVVKERVFNDCPSSTLVTTNQYPSLISFHDSELDCVGFANLDVWRFSEDGTTPAIFDNNAAFRFASDFKLEGSGNGEGGLQIAPWWSQDADGLFNVRSTDGEIACFGGRLPFYSFTAAAGLRYTKGDVIHLEAIYTPHARTAADPATIEYRVRYKGTSYTSGVLPFDQGNPAEDPPHTLYGMLNEGRVGGHFKAFVGQGVAVDVQGTFTNITFGSCLTPADVSFELMPRTLNLGSEGEPVLVVIRPAPPLQASDIDVASLTLNGVPPLAVPLPVVAEHDSKLLVWFDRPAFAATVSTAGRAVPVELTGEAKGLCIDATGTINAIAPPMAGPLGGPQNGGATSGASPAANGETPQLALSVTNPAGRALRLGFSLASAEPARLVVFDIAGRQVSARELGGRAGAQLLSLPALPAGLYVVQLSQSGRAITRRVVVLP